MGPTNIVSPEVAWPHGVRFQCLSIPGPLCTSAVTTQGQTPTYRIMESMPLQDGAKLLNVGTRMLRYFKGSATLLPLPAKCVFHLKNKKALRKWILFLRDILGRLER